jgi:hypothetical protein
MGKTYCCDCNKYIGDFSTDVGDVYCRECAEEMVKED